LAILYKKSVRGEELSVKVTGENKNVESPVKLIKKAKGEVAIPSRLFRKI